MKQLKSKQLMYPLLLLLVVVIIISMCIAGVVVSYYYGNKPFTVTFLGDSITEQYPITTSFPQYNAINKGIYNEQSTATLSRTQSVIELTKPDVLVLLIGTNDLASGSDIQTICDNIKKIIDMSLSSESINAIIVQSVYPLDTILREHYYYNNVTIRALNDLIKKMIQEYDIPNDKLVEFLDVYSHLVDDNDNLIASYHTDGLHVNTKCYSAITKIVLPRLQNIFKIH